MDEFCGSQQPGTVMPTRSEWMSRLNASERSVRWALDELQRQGKIVRRQGAGVYVADKAHTNGSNGLDAKSVMWGGNAPLGQAGANRTVAVIAKPDHSIFDRAVELLYAQATDADLSLVCRPFDPNLGVLNVEALPESDRPLGYILFRRDLLPLARSLQSVGHRVVLIGSLNVGEEGGVPNVYSDSEKGGYLAARHLLDLGHRRLGFLADNLTLKTRRWRGQEKAIDEARKRGVHIETTHFKPEQVQEWRFRPTEARAFFTSPNAPTGVLAWNDHEALPLLSLLASIGLRVPEDISVVGHDNLPVGQLVHPQLTTVDIAIEQMLQAALNLLTQPKAPSPDHTTIALPALIRRDSSARANY